MKNGREKKKQSTEMDEVEQLLQAAHDDVFLKLSLNSHTVSSSSSSLDPDLTRRFQSLKSGPPKPNPNPNPNPKPNPIPPPASCSSVPVDDELKAVLGDDLSARFAALKGSLYSSSSASSSSSITTTDVAAATKSSVGSVVVSSGGDEKEEEEEDEVEKVIQWAIDAARLDPSPPSDLDTDDDEEEEDDDDDEDEEDTMTRKGNEKNKKEENSKDNKKK